MSSIPGDLLVVNSASPFSAGSPAYLVTATSSGAAHTIHTAVTGTTSVDLVTLDAQCVDGATSYQLTLEVGGVTIGPIQVSRLASPLRVLDGVPINNGLTVKAYANTTSKIVLVRKVVRLLSKTV